MAKFIFNMPDIGEGIAEAEIVSWHVKPGDRVEEDQEIVDMMTDKATVPMESPVAGTVVEVAGGEGDMVSIGAMLVVIETEGEVEHAAEPEVVVYFELYGRPTVGFDANIEIAESLTGPALATVKPTPAATAVADKFMFTAKVPIASLKPGDYVVRARLTFEGQPTAVLTRTIRKK